jgi:hypothetical protein
MEKAGQHTTITEWKFVYPKLKGGQRRGLPKKNLKAM